LNIKTEGFDLNSEIVNNSKKDKLEVKNQSDKNAGDIVDNVSILLKYFSSLICKKLIK